ncbi:MAG TPA: AAA family ATPase [Acidimicrobiales bacterium]|nr:AAA family ATPase [Acidimicrobiales bacterium]
MCDTCGGHGDGSSHSLRHSQPDHHAHDHTQDHPHDHHAHEHHVHEHGGGKRVVVVGKGGVGKSTLCALMARTLAREGRRVVAVDADEQRNLAATLGLGLTESVSIVPVAENADYVEEKTGARPGEGAGGMLVLNPDTSDLVDRLSVEAPDGVRLVVMGGVRGAGAGCLCPETALISSAVAGMRLRGDDVVVMDTHAGVEHFGRALARGFDSVLVVVEPTFNAVQVGMESAALAGALGIGEVHLVVNRTRSDGDVDRVMDYVEQLGGPPFSSVTWVPYDAAALLSEPSVDALLDRPAVVGVVGALSARVAGALNPSLAGVG